MRTEGSTISGTSYSGQGRDLGLPKPPETGIRPAHRPWCVDCKRHHDPDQLDTDGRCGKCAHAAITRAEAAERRDREAEARAEAAKREKATQRADRAHAATHVIDAGTAATTPPPTVRAKVSQAATPHGVLIALRGDNLAHRQTEVAGLLNDLLTALNTTQAPAPAPRTRSKNTKPRRPRTTSFPLERAKQLLTDGHSVPQIATELGCAVSTARRHLQRAGITIPDGRTTHSGGGNTKTTHDDDPQLRNTLVDRYTAGESTVTLARDLDLTAKQVNAILRRAGVTIRPRASVGKPIDEEDVLTRYAEGASIVAIARDLGVHATRIRALLAGHDIQIRPKGNSGQIGARLRDLGVTARDVKEWAHAQGLIDQIRSGLVAGHLIDAYAAAHNNESGDTA